MSIAEISYMPSNTMSPSYKAMVSKLVLQTVITIRCPKNMALCQSKFSKFEKNKDVMQTELTNFLRIDIRSICAFILQKNMNTCTGFFL